MAGNLKQRLIKAGRDFNYAEGVKVLNSDADNPLVAGTLLCGVGAEGPFLKVKDSCDRLGDYTGSPLDRKARHPSRWVRSRVAMANRDF